MEKLILTSRQWNQIRAALQFWACVQETSKVPPIKHPKICSFFERIPALSLQEIEELMAYNLVSEMIDGASLRQIARERGFSVRRLLAQLKRMNIRPIRRIERANLYRPEDVLKACRILWQRDYKHIRRYEGGFLRGSNQLAKTGRHSSE